MTYKVLLTKKFAPILREPVPEMPCDVTFYKGKKNNNKFLSKFNTAHSKHSNRCLLCRWIFTSQKISNIGFAFWPEANFLFLLKTLRAYSWQPLMLQGMCLQGIFIYCVAIRSIFIEEAENICTRHSCKGYLWRYRKKVAIFQHLYILKI